jgi:hypothetical protein
MPVVAAAVAVDGTAGVDVDTVAGAVAVEPVDGALGDTRGG